MYSPGGGASQRVANLRAELTLRHRRGRLCSRRLRPAPWTQDTGYDSTGTERGHAALPAHLSIPSARPPTPPRPASALPRVVSSARLLNSALDWRATDLRAVALEDQLGAAHSQSRRAQSQGATRRRRPCSAKPQSKGTAWAHRTVPLAHLPSRSSSPFPLIRHCAQQRCSPPWGSSFPGSVCMVAIAGANAPSPPSECQVQRSFSAFL